MTQAACGRTEKHGGHALERGKICVGNIGPMFVEQRKAAKHIAYCLVCMGGGKELCQPTTKRKAETAAVSHMNAYGHSVTLFER